MASEKSNGLMISRRPFRLSTLILFTFLGFFGTTSRLLAADAVVTDVQTQGSDEDARFALDMDRRVSFRLFTLTDPYRVVLDLPEIGWRLPARPLPGEQGIFQRLRYGLFRAGNSRVVLDFNAPVHVTDAFITARPGGGFRIVVETEKTSRERFLAGLSLPPRQVAELRATPTARKPSQSTGQRRLQAVADRTAALVAPNSGTSSTVRLKNPASAVPATVEPPALTPSRYLPMPPRRPGSIPQHRRPFIVIDPGHGGVDPGARSVRGVYEKHIVLALSRELRRQLLATKRYRADLTRDRDVFIRLRDRVAIARDRKADLFISLHADSIRNNKVSGPSVYTLSEKASDKEAEELADRENKADLIAGIDLTHESADVTNILIDLAQRESMNQSARFAAILVRALSERTTVLPRPHRFAGFAVLKAPDLASVLVETGFLSNGEDERRLTNKAYRRRLAAAIVAAIDRYFGSVEQAKVR